MSALLNKSNDNYTAMQLLSEKKLYASATHCAYYRCLQFMKHILLNGISATVANDYLILAAQKKMGSHFLIINQIKMKINRVSYRDFSNLIYQLKELREEAEYDDTVCIVDSYNKAKSKSDKIMEDLKLNFVKK